jgi:hypothetical protein
MLRDYLEEVTERVKLKTAGYREERYRLYFNGQTPAWGSHIAEKYAAVTVACSYTHIPDLYARNVHAYDAMRALAAPPVPVSSEQRQVDRRDHFPPV